MLYVNFATVCFTGTVPAHCSDVSSVVMHTMMKHFYILTMVVYGTVTHNCVIINSDNTAALRAFIQTLCVCVCIYGHMWYSRGESHVGFLHACAQSL